MSDYEFDFWQCGHITSAEDGSIVSENGDLVALGAPRSSIQKHPSDLCSGCHADQLMARLRDIRTLLSECDFRNEAMQMAERRVAALKRFLPDDPEGRFMANYNKYENYPTELLKVEHHVLQLELETCHAAIEGFAAGRKRLRSRIAQSFIDRINQIGESALVWYDNSYCSDDVKEYLLEIIKETEVMIEAIEIEAVVESHYLAALDAEAANLRRLLNGYDPKIGERFEEALGNPSSEKA
ncbi:hypothetical protein F5Y12DRAFT_792298 [Xylaria sp. FL1777]|nr:hypothetical protein F5Y12DRAFT_792298 [Xylaria sp. FL1777]